MPMVYHRNGQLRVSRGTEYISRMSMRELIAYEAVLWKWIDKASNPVGIRSQLNAIHREVEWRAMEKDWRNAAHPR